MKLYNTLSRSVEDIKPLNPPQVTVYTCGPTVYDYPHIGNWFTFLRYDLLIRALKLSGLEPNWVMNITDVGHLVSDGDDGEDKLQKGARRENRTAWDVAAFYSENFENGIAKLNMLTAAQLPRATDHIQDQIELIKTLEEKGYAYKIDDGIYFDTAKFESYGAMARLDIDQLRAGARVEYNSQKHQPTDFALWKFSPTVDHENDKRDMEWESPWGTGFPGWHIECSAMSMKYLGQSLDIHAGGIDHIPVHHSNEIAQSEAATGKPFCKYWLHANHILVNGQKISKSLDNSIRLEEIESAGYSPLDLRLLAMESHYRSQSQFSWEGLAAAEKRRYDFGSFADLRFQANPDAPRLVENYLQIQKDAVLAALMDDLNTPIILRILNETSAKLEANGLHTDDLEELNEFLSKIDSALGLNLTASNTLSDDLVALITERTAARADKNWTRSDELRASLEKVGIGIHDMPFGTIWFRLRPE